jgi:hypothetical protein
MPAVPGPIRTTIAALGAAAALAATVLGGAGALADTSTAPCGTETAATVQSVVASVATNIYRGELIGGEVFADARRIANSAKLLAAVRSGRRAAVYAAVHALVYHPLWHIVRLRVSDTRGRILADIGGPYIIAPVPGVLRSGGATIGTFVMSVQDDVGFTKLETHAAGDPIGIYYRGRLVASLGAHFPALPPTADTMTVGSVAHAVVRQSFNAFPAGTLTSVILVPPPPASWSALPCIAVRTAEIGHVAQLLSHRFHPLDASYGKFALVVHDDTGALVILRIGARAIAGSEGLGPPVIPPSGPVSYQNKSFWVFSFAPTPPARIYLLVSAPPTTSTTTTTTTSGG